MIIYIGNEGRHKILFKSSSGKHYKFIFHSELQQWTCNCPSAIYRGQRCKHLAAFNKGELQSVEEKVDEFQT